MADQLAAAQAALNAGRASEAVDHLIGAVTENPARPASVYRALVAQAYRTGRFGEGEAFAAKGLERYPRDYDLLNTRGVLLRKLKRQPEAVRVLEQAVKLDPKNTAAQQNLGNVLLDLNDGVRAEAVFTRLVRLDPRNSEYQRQLGRSFSKQGKIEPALLRFRQAVSLKRDNLEAWLDLVGTFTEESRIEEAEEALDKGLVANPGAQRLVEAKAMMMRRFGQLRRAETFLEGLLPENPNAAWLHHQIGILVADWDRLRANRHLEQAVALDPANLEYAITLIESLERTRIGDEGAHIERAYRLALDLLPRRLQFTEMATKVLAEVFIRVCDYDSLEQMGDFKTIGRGWAETGRHTALLKQLARVRTDSDRYELLEQHRIWGRAVEAAAARRPIKRRPRAPTEKIRLGFMSSDLRQHPVGYFAMPLFDHIDKERFEVFIYSYYLGEEDSTQRAITERVTAYRWWPEVNSMEAAQRIADEQLDVLFELGGTTHMNRLDVMAYRPAPVQASWLGYPHSAGLSTIDYLVCDPHNVPERPDLIIEKPMMMPESWIALGERFFSNTVEIRDDLAEDRNGFITYGTANNPHKYTADVLRAWARIVAATPNSRFAFIRPEGGTASFRANIERAFAAEGVSADRLVWHTVRGAHLPYYNEVDITLDPFPLTGGTTTTEALWMGAPVVSLKGPAFYERLSASILANSGVGDMTANTPDEFQRIALDLAGDRARRVELRRTLRQKMKAGALGQTERFARDFYDMVARTVRG